MLLFPFVVINIPSEVPEDLLDGLDNYAKKLNEFNRIVEENNNNLSEFSDLLCEAVNSLNDYKNQKEEENGRKA